ncbi:MAG TPA: DUF2779 domain-containing protein, partial [Steroidobacteraceae bacterium]|nr:DUF2779 domain-containing protein [Steroidobacteraceae bacterium]
MRTLSKSKLLAFRQCPKRLWLEVHRRDLSTHATGASVGFTAGQAVGAVARKIYDPDGVGELVDVTVLGVGGAVKRTQELWALGRPIFEAGFVDGGASAIADVLLPVETNGKRAWQMVEVKSATIVKDYHRDDAAIQAYVARVSGLPPNSISVATVDTGWVYPGGEDYRGLLVEEDLTVETMSREAEVRGWIEAAQAVVGSRVEPMISTGHHCNEPFPCGFLAYCRSREAPVEFPVSWLPNVRTKKLKAHLSAHKLTRIDHVPDELLNERQLRVKQCSLSGQPFFDVAGAAAALASHGFPAFFLDFETLSFAVPIWAGTRPYQSFPFQFSVHRVTPSGEVQHREFLDLSGNDPREALALALLAACETAGPVYVYSAYEKTQIRELKRRLPHLAEGLSALMHRLVDLRPIAEKFYYHPSQQGSWSIKEVLPAITGHGYEELEGIKDGGMAMEAYVEAIGAVTSATRKT